MGSWSEELAQRKTAARERLGSLHRQIAELTGHWFRGFP
jgi:hypothetical protein